MIERSIRYGFLALITALLMSCGGSGGGSDDDGPDDDGGDGNGGSAEISQLTAGAGSEEIPVDTSVLVFADITDTNGDGVSGQNVSFSTSGGSLSAPSDSTNSNGRASVTLTAPQNLGSGVVTMSAAGFTDSVTIDFVSGPPDSVNLAASPTTLGFNRTSDLVISVVDSFGNPVADQTVQLSSNPNNSGGSFTNVLVSTDTNGRATGEYVTGGTAGNDTLNATTGSVSDSAGITVDPNAVDLNSMTLVSGSPDIVADGSAETFIRATVLDTDNQPVEGITVNFGTSAGTLTATSDVTDSNGRAEVRLQAGTNVATAQVTAAVGGLNESIEVEFVPGPADLANSSITANPTSLPADGTSETTIVVTLADANNNPVAPTNVTLQTGAGTITTDNPAETSLGRAEFTLQAPNSSGNTTVSVQELTGLETQVRFGSTSSGNPASIQINVDPQEIFVAGVGKEEQASINLSILDDSGNPINEAGYGDTTLNNVRVTLVTRPNGGEVITGTDAAGDPVTSSGTGFVDVRSDNGSVTLNLQSGTLPGTVEAEVKVLDFSGTDFTDPNDVAATASLPQITIASGPPHTIAFTSPVTNSITDEGSGVYSRVGKLLVTDRFGNAVPDGTSLNLGLVDSVIAKGGSGQTTSGSIGFSESTFDFDLRCTSPTSCAAETFNFMSTISRNGVQRGLQTADRVLILNAQAEDKSRFIDAVTGRNSVDVQTAYDNSASDLNFVAGASLLGAEIFGTQGGGETAGSVTTLDGVAPFRVRYPANADRILTGCYGTLPDGTYVRDDKRYEVPQSAQVYVVASSSDRDAVSVDRGQYCFGAIAGTTLEPTPSSTTGDATISLELRDGGDTITLPFVPVSGFVTQIERSDTSAFDLTVSINNNAENAKPQTNINGVATADIDVNCNDGATCESGDSAVVTFRALDAEATVTVTIP